MPDEPFIEDAVAIVPVSDMGETVRFYTEVLGFEKRLFVDDETFAIVVHGDAAIHFVKGDAQAVAATATNISIYLWVKFVDELYAKLKPLLDELGDGRVRPPFDQTYGMREFHVKDPDGCLLFFGEAID